MEAKKEKKQNFMHGAAILTVGVIVMKVLGAIYKIPLANILGASGYGVFLATYSVYNIFFTVSTAGLPVALSRLIAEADANGLRNQKQKTFRAALGTFAVIGAVFSLIMFFGSGWIAENYLQKPETALSLKTMAPAVMLVCLVSAYRGFCQGNGNMIPTTVDEVLEVLFKVISGLIIATLLMRTFADRTVGSAGAIAGVSIGGLISLLFMVIYKSRNYPQDKLAAGDDVPDATGKIVKDILRIGIPISLGASIMAILSSFDPGICQSRLLAAGFEKAEADVLYGTYAEVQTLFNLPAAFMTPLTIAIVPAVAGALAKGNRAEATGSSEDAMRIASVISMPMGAGLAVLSYPIVNVFYSDSHVSGPGLLSIMGAASFFVCIVLMENAILQASGKERLPMYAMVTGSLLKIAINYVIIARPEINIYGAPVGTLCGYLCMAVMDYIFIRTKLNMKPRLRNVFGRPLLCSVLMSAAAAGIYALVSALAGTAGKMQLAVCMLVSIAAAVAVYVAAVVLLKAVTLEDMKLIPGGEKVGRMLHMR